ncbi:ATP-dependent helicase [Vibrio cholerae]|uniref:ATP-dependent helicase n=1 Tax=Vibrio cholerae TaxID=666 RepID=UPI0009B2AD51|nr:ATP-dependent helicase [Vibrio cholerae]TXY77954.1 ATP-dependent helicase [Vibrio cholerae]GIB16622.1 ATP-dependent DNA helicase UvrD1 [Vibrio cholerae]
MDNNSIKSLIDSLNNEQRMAALSTHNRIRVIAGPGTGKTKVIQSRIAHLIEDRKVDPTQILAISFTNEAAKELTDRILEVCPEVGFKTQTYTFHGYGNKRTKPYQKSDFFVSKLGYTNGMSIIDESDSRSLLEDAKKSLSPKLASAIKIAGIDNRKFFSELSQHRARCLNVAGFSKKVRNRMTDTDLTNWSEFLSQLETISDEHLESFVLNALKGNPIFFDVMIASLWNEYFKQCRLANGVDFDDILLNFYFLLRSEPAIAKKIAHGIRHLLVDEYQDTCMIQAYIIRELCKANPAIDLFLVGDTRQSIYGFRAADVTLLTHAEDIFGEFETIELIQNYRSHPNLIEFNNIFAPTMVGQITQGILTSGRPQAFPTQQDPSINGIVFDNEKDEAQWVVNKAMELIEAGTSPDEIYILYRNRNAAKPIENALRQNQISFEMVGEKNFYETLEIRDAVAFFRSLARPSDILAWARLCTVGGFGVRGVYLRDKHKENGAQPIDIILSRRNAANTDRINNFINFHENSKNLLSLSETDFRLLFNEQMHPDLSIHDINYHIDNYPRANQDYLNWKSDYLLQVIGDVMEQYIAIVQASYEDIDAKATKLDPSKNPEEVTANRIQNVVHLFNEVLNRLESGEELSIIVDDIMTRDTPQRHDRSLTIKMMTGHAAKGLEADHVFLVGSDAAIWGDISKMSEETSAEEQRIYYVMATRAKTNMYVSMANFRVVNGEGMPSRPFEPIISHLLEGQRRNSYVQIENKTNRQLFGEKASNNNHNSSHERINSNVSKKLMDIHNRIATNTEPEQPDEISMETISHQM